MLWLVWHQNEFLRVRTPELDDRFDPYLTFTSRSLGQYFCQQGQLAGVQCELMSLKTNMGFEYGGFLVFSSRKMIDLYMAAPEKFPNAEFVVPRSPIVIAFLPAFCFQVILFLKNKLGKVID